MPKSMPGLKKSIFRMVGMVINLIALVVMIIGFFVMFGKDEDTLPVNLLILVFIGLMILFLKWMNDFVDDHRKIFLIVLLALACVLFPILIESTFEKGMWILGLTYIGAVLHTLYWHYSLSIYKKEKLMFIIFFAVVALCYIMPLLVLEIEELLVWPIVSVIIMMIGLLMVLLTENSMRKAKLLNYI